MGAKASESALSRQISRQAELGWRLPSSISLWSNLGIFFPALFGYLAVQVLGCIEATATNQKLIVGMAGTSACLFIVWLMQGVYLSGGIFVNDAVQDVLSHSSLEGSTYDKNGDWYTNSFAADPNAEFTCGVRFSPKICNGVLIKLNFRVKCAFKAFVLALSVARGVLIEAGRGQDDLYVTLTTVAIVLGAFLFLDFLVGLVFGSERSPTTLIALAIYRCGTGREPPFEPVDELVHAAQGFSMAVEISSWTVTVPLLRRIYDIQVTSSWLLPLFSSVLALVYSVTAIHYKCCPAALLIGKLRPLIGPLSPYRFKEGVEVRGLSYSIWGPFNMLDDKAEKGGGGAPAPAAGAAPAQQEEDEEEDVFTV